MILAKNDPPKNDPPKSEKMILTKMIFSLHRGWAPTQQQQRSMFIQWTARSTCPSTRLVKMVITSTRSLKMFIVVTSLRMLMLAIVVVDDPLKILVVDDTPFTASLPSWPDHTHCASSSKKTVTSLLKMRRSRTSLMMLTTMYNVHCTSTGSEEMPQYTKLSGRITETLIRFHCCWYFFNTFWCHTSWGLFWLLDNS